jgi:hypothetical protein
MFDLDTSEGRIREDAVRKFVIYSLEDDEGRTIEELVDSTIPNKIRDRKCAEKLYDSLSFNLPSGDELSRVADSLEKGGYLVCRDGVYHIKRFWG